jgi:hypothetical protein
MKCEMKMKRKPSKNGANEGNQYAIMRRKLAEKAGDGGSENSRRREKKAERTKMAAALSPNTEHGWLT